MFEILALAALLGGAPKPKPKRSPMLLRVFNAFQVVTLFSALPYIIGWLYTGPFPFSVAAFVTAIIVYAILFCWQGFAMVESLGD
jgi:hypothetical protein